MHVAGWTSSEVAQLIPSCRILSAVGFWVSVNSANIQVTMEVFGCWDCSLAVLGVLLVEQPSLQSCVLSIWLLSEYPVCCRDRNRPGPLLPVASHWACHGGPEWGQEWVWSESEPWPAGCCLISMAREHRDDTGRSLRPRMSPVQMFPHGSELPWCLGQSGVGDF